MDGVMPVGANKGGASRARNEDGSLAEALPEAVDKVALVERKLVPLLGNDA